LKENLTQTLRLPMYEAFRSLNLASTVNTVAYEAVRQIGGLPNDPGPAEMP
jgi:tRNA (cytidine/uridine-2'-O-)-methyltransferase